MFSAAVPDGGEGGQETAAQPKKGWIELDDFTFDKVVDGSRNVFVMAYTTWDDDSNRAAADWMGAVGKELGEQANLLLVKVDVDENENLKKRFGIVDADTADDEEAPPMKFLIAKKSAGKEGIAFEDVVLEAGITAEGVMEEIGTVAGGAGTVPELAPAVEAFVAKPNAAAKAAAEKLVNTLPEHEKVAGQYYLKVMTKALAKGKDYPKTEAARLVRMIEGGALRADKTKEFRYRINALRVFDPSIPKPPAPKASEDAEEDAEDAEEDAESNAEL